MVTDENTAKRKSGRTCDVCRIGNISESIQDLTWQPVGFIRERLGKVSIFTDHDRNRSHRLVGNVDQYTAIVPGEDCVSSGVVDVDVHPCCADPPMTQSIDDPDL